MAFGLIELLIAIAAVVIGIYYYLVSNYNFWKSQGVPGPPPSLFYGNLKDIYRGKISRPIFFQELNRTYRDEPMVGIYISRNPTLVVYDLDLVKTILVKDFSKFVDRDVHREIFNPLAQHLFRLESKKWRPLRTKLSPVFSSGKLRDMFYLLNQCANHFEKYLDKVDGQCVDMRDIAAKFTTDAIGLCAFGLEAKSFESEDSVFRKMGKRVFQMDWKKTLKFQLTFFFWPLYKLVGNWLEDHELNDFFINLARDTVDYRKKMNIQRHDFVDLLRHLQEEPREINDIELTNSLMAAQMFMFFAAGFETSSSTISNCLLELALNHEIQDKLRAEIREELGESGTITYDGIKKMKYLDMVVKETLRKWPPATFLLRMAAEDYTIPGTNVFLPARTRILIPVFAIQRDPRHYPNPEVFNPENFTAEAVKNRHPMSFLAFGDGPRICIGSRFGTVQSKVGLVKIIQKFVVDVCEKTDKSYEQNNKSFLLTPKNGIVLKVTKCSTRS